MAAVWTQVVLWILLQACLIGVSGLGRTSRGSSYSRSSSSTFRSSASSYRASSVYRGSRLASSYISYNPGARYSRVYSSTRMGSYYFYYYNLYFSYIGTPAYYRRPAISQTATVCVNYETNDNDSYIGVFVCPLGFEPSEFTQCCGDEYAEFCCKKSSVSVVFLITGVIVGIIAFAILIIVIRHICIRQSNRGKVIAPPPGQQRPPGQRRPPGQGQPPGQGRPPGPGRPPVQRPPQGQGQIPRQPFPQEPPNYGIFTVADGMQEVKPPPYQMSDTPLSPPPAYSAEWQTPHGATAMPTAPGDYQIPLYNPAPYYPPPPSLPQPQNTAP